MKKLLTWFSFCLIALFIAAVPAWSKGSVDPKSELMKPESVEEPAMEEIKYKEAPILAELVAKGELPPVEERLPKEPKVVETIESIGRYGGDLRVFAPNIYIGNALQTIFGANLYHVPRSGMGLEPNLAIGYEIAEDKTSFTIFLRDGVRWSDGYPFTAEDIRFMFEDIHMNKNFRSWNFFGNVTDVEVLDDYTAVLHTPSGIGKIPVAFATGQSGENVAFKPAHYLKKWHPDYNPDAETVAKEEGFDSAKSCLEHHYFWVPVTDADQPEMEAWDLVQIDPSFKVFQRNPYYFRVDEEGNQLPYIDRLLVQIVEEQVMQLKATGGDADLFFHWASLDNLELYKQNEKAGDYSVTLHPGSSGSQWTLCFYQNHSDPGIRSILNDVRFRQAMSVAINRAEMNDILANGLGIPRQAAPLPSTSFYKEGWSEYYAQYDPSLANKLLDEMGLNKKDKDGFRLRPDGEKLTMILMYSTQITSAMELVKEYWEDVGVRILLKMESGELIGERITNDEVMIWTHPRTNYPACGPERDLTTLGIQWGMQVGSNWGDWMTSKADAVREKLGVEEGGALPEGWRWMETPDDDKLKGEKPPEDFIRNRDNEDKFLNATMLSAEYKEYGLEVFDYWVTNLFKIGTVGQFPNIVLAKNKLGNVPPVGWVTGIPYHDQIAEDWADVLYWKE